MPESFVDTFTRSGMRCFEVTFRESLLPREGRAIYWLKFFHSLSLGCQYGLCTILPHGRAIVQITDVEIAIPDFTAVIGEHNPSRKILTKAGGILELAGFDGFGKMLRI